MKIGHITRRPAPRRRSAGPESPRSSSCRSARRRRVHARAAVLLGQVAPSRPSSPTAAPAPAGSAPLVGLPMTGRTSLVDEVAHRVPHHALLRRQLGPGRESTPLDAIHSSFCLWHRFENFISSFDSRYHLIDDAASVNSAVVAYAEDFSAFTGPAQDHALDRTWNAHPFRFARFRRRGRLDHRRRVRDSLAAMSGAEPCTASKIAASSRCWPGTRPRPRQAGGKDPTGCREHVRRDDHVEACRIEHQLHRHRVDDPLVELDVRIAAGELASDVEEQPA